MNFKAESKTCNTCKERGKSLSFEFSGTPKKCLDYLKKKMGKINNSGWGCYRFALGRKEGKGLEGLVFAIKEKMATEA